MAKWFEADRSHLPLLHKFTCIAKAVVGPGSWHKRRTDHSWAREVEASIRRLRVPLKYPHRADVLVDAEAGRIDAAVVFRSTSVSPREHQFLALYLARHLDCAGKAAGLAALTHFTDTCLGLVEDMPDVRRLVLAGHVHKLNTPIQSLLLQHGWESEEEDAGDPNLVWWRKRYTIMPPG